MVKWIPPLLLVGLTVASACTDPVVRTVPCVWEFRGAVVSVNGTVLRVQNKTGEVLSVEIDDRTSYLRNKQPDSRSSLLRGTRVSVEVETLQRGLYRARLVQIYGGGRPDSYSSSR